MRSTVQARPALLQTTILQVYRSLQDCRFYFHAFMALTFARFRLLGKMRSADEYMLTQKETYSNHDTRDF